MPDVLKLVHLHRGVGPRVGDRSQLVRNGFEAFNLAFDELVGLRELGTDDDYLGNFLVADISSMFKR